MTVEVPDADVVSGTSFAPLSMATNVRCATGAPSLSNSLTSAAAFVPRPGHLKHRRPVGDVGVFNRADRDVRKWRSLSA